MQFKSVNTRYVDSVAQRVHDNTIMTQSECPWPEVSHTMKTDTIIGEILTAVKVTIKPTLLYCLFIEPLFNLKFRNNTIALQCLH